jgi:hypothetical protein
MATPINWALTALAVQRHLLNVVVRSVCDSDGNCLAAIVEAHDGTESGMIAAAQIVTQRMYAEHPAASNIQSRMVATDETGTAKWAISPNFRHLAELGTPDACYIWGEINGHR